MLIWGEDDQTPAHWNFPAMQMGSNGTASSFLIESTTERAFGNRAARRSQADGILMGVATGGSLMEVKGKKEGEVQ